jgi:alpha-L-fucosidase 2
MRSTMLICLITVICTSVSAQVEPIEYVDLMMATISQGGMPAQTPSYHTLVSEEPATRWEEALLTGNGNMGAMVFGRPYNETIVVNHCRLYLPQGHREIVQDFGAFMPAFKDAGLKAGPEGPAVVHRMMQAKTTQKIIPTDPFHPAFLLSVDMGHRSEKLRHYQRRQNLATGEVTVQWSDDLGDWQRQLFVSRPDNLVVLQISGPAGKVACDLSLDIQHDLVQPQVSVTDGWISAHTVYTKGKGGYDSLLRVTSVGGQIIHRDKTLRVSSADQVLILMQVRPWKTPLAAEQSEAWAYSPEHPDFAPGYKTDLIPAMKQDLERISTSYKALLKPHVRKHGDLFSRVSLDLKAGSARSASSEVLLDQAIETQTMSPALMERMYDACRYLTICSTGTRPANLQGIWNGTWKPAWSGDYTLDSNLQLEIQSLLSCNLPELMSSYFDLVESWLPDCRLNARKFYGCRGAVSNARASNTCLLLHWDPWPGEQAISCLGWLAHFYYDYYLFTGDKVFLAERVVPLMQEVVLFYSDLYPSFMMSYWPGLKGFGMDPVGTLPDMVNNSLIYAWDGTVDLLPALPEAWPSGSIRGILARNQLRIETLAWDRPAGTLELTLSSGVSQTLSMRLPPRYCIASAQVTKNASLVGEDDGDRFFKLKIPANQRITLKISFKMGF